MLADIPQNKWGSGTGRQVILKSDFQKMEAAVVESFDLFYCPDLEFVDAVQVKVPATSDCRARLMMCGFPSPLHRGLFVNGGLSDGRYRENSSNAVLNFNNPSTYWGTEKSDQWYCVYAVAGANDAIFTLKGMPVMRFSSQEAQTVTLRNNGNSGNIGYGFMTNELTNAKLLVLSGVSQGQARPITANNNDNASAGAISYSGESLNLFQGDWFIVLPNTNYRYLGMVFNDNNGNLVSFHKVGARVTWNTSREIVSGPLNGYLIQDLGLKVPPVARRLLGQAVAFNGYDVKLGLSYDGVNLALAVHSQPPTWDFQGVRGAMPFDCHLLDGGKIYFNNENTANQTVRAVGWEE